MMIQEFHCTTQQNHPSTTPSLSSLRALGAPRVGSLTYLRPLCIYMASDFLHRTLSQRNHRTYSAPFPCTAQKVGPFSMWKLSKLRAECQPTRLGSLYLCSLNFLEVQKSTFNICKAKVPLKPFSSALGPLTFELTMQSSRRWALLHPSFCSHLLNPTTSTLTLCRSSK